MVTGETLWALEEHTKGKHAVLKAYLSAWFPILSKYNNRVLFIDGFAAPGRYQGGEDGSPLIAIKILREHKATSKIKEAIFLFIEADLKRAEHLKGLLMQLDSAGQIPSNCKAQVVTGKFDEHLTAVLDVVDEQKKILAPAFVMVDPFGISATPMAVIRRLFQNEKVEVYISLMYEFLNRFKTTPEFEANLDSLFGSPDWRNDAELKDALERKNFFFDLYEDQLRNAGATHVVRFELFEGRRLKYAIFFGSKNQLGADKMKQAVWKLAPRGDFAFRGGRAHQLELRLDEVDYGPLRSAVSEFIKSRFPNCVAVEDVEGFVIDRTDYHSRQYKSQALKQLEEEGRIEADPKTRKRRGTYPPGTRLRWRQ